MGEYPPGEEVAGPLFWLVIPRDFPSARPSLTDSYFYACAALKHSDTPFCHVLAKFEHTTNLILIFDTQLKQTWNLQTMID